MTKDELRTDIDNWLADNETFVSNNYSRTELLMLMYEYGKHLLQQRTEIAEGRPDHGEAGSKRED